MSQGGSPYVMRLLLVEDDPSLASGIRIALKPEHYTVDHLTDGESALNALQSEPFDAVILDLGLPNVDGIEVLRTIRRHGNHVPILVLTARDAVDHRIEGLDSGADDYLTKPFEVDELKARLRALLRRSQGHTKLRCGQHHHHFIDTSTISEKLGMAAKRNLSIINDTFMHWCSNNSIESPIQTTIQRELQCINNIG